MTRPTENVKLYGERADQFRQKKQQLAEVLGHEPTNAQVVGLMMADFDPSDVLSVQRTPSR